MESEDDLTVWCGNLPNQADEELLYELFLQVAPLKKVRIPTDKSGKYMNYGFVTFKHQVSVPYAIDMFNNIQLYDRTIIVRSRNPPGVSKGAAALPPPPTAAMQAPATASANDFLRLGMGFGMGMVPLIHMPVPMMPLMIPPAQHQQHEYHGKERSRHAQHYNDKPYRQHSNHRNNNRSNNRNRYRY